MYIDIRLYVFLIGALILLSIIIVSLVISYMAANRRLSRLEENEDELYKKTIQEEKEILARAQSDYEKTIEDANAEARKLISKAGDISESSQNALNQAVSELTEKEKGEIEKKSSEFIKNYQEQISQINENNIKRFKSVSDEVLKTVGAHFDELKKALSEQTVESHKIAEDKIKSEYEKLEEELKNYRNEQLKRLDNNIYEVLFTVSKAVLGRSLNFEDHEGLILDALEQAKSEKVFNA